MIFVPASITAFFSTRIVKDPLKCGSLGVGITIEKGVDAKLTKNRGVYFNGERIEFPTVEYVMERLKLQGVEIKSDLPLSCGFGLSGASALATAFVANQSLNLGKSYFELADLAHEAEVVNKTGLGDVVCQSIGGVIVRTLATCPSRVRYVKYLWDLKLDFLVLGGLKTDEFLGEDVKEGNKSKRRINTLGKLCLKEFLKKPTPRNLFLLSKKFSLETGLGEDVRDVIEAVESVGGLASMAMLGKTVFAINGMEAFKEFRGLKFSSNITHCGVKVKTI